jgi:hypothetical protein
MSDRSKTLTAFAAPERASICLRRSSAVGYRLCDASYSCKSLQKVLHTAVDPVHGPHETLQCCSRARGIYWTQWIGLCRVRNIRANKDQLGQKNYSKRFGTPAEKRHRGSSPSLASLACIGRTHGFHRTPCSELSQCARRVSNFDLPRRSVGDLCRAGASQIRSREFTRRGELLPMQNRQEKAIEGRCDRKVSGRELLTQRRLARFIAGRGFLRFEAKALRRSDDVGEKRLVALSRLTVRRHLRRVVAVRSEKGGRHCLPDLLGCPLEREIAGGGRGQDTNAAQHCVRHAAVLCRIAGESIGRIHLFERAAAVKLALGRSPR